jgi:uncharacterized membrane protein
MPGPTPAPMPHATAAATPDPVVRRSRAAALAGLLALIALGLAWELWLAPTGTGTLALKVLPLALCVAGLLRHRMYTFRWLSMLVWLYFMEGATRVVTDTGISRWLAAAEIVLSLWLFACSAFYIRWRLRQGRLLAQAQAEQAAGAPVGTGTGTDTSATGAIAT